MTDETKVMEEKQLESLKAKATQLGVSFSPNIGIDTLRARINEKLAEDEQKTVAAVEPEKPAAAVKPETPQQRNQRLRREATRLVRIRVSNMNPATREHEGAYFTAGNSLVGDHTKYVRYDVPWHVPNIIYQHLKEREIQLFRKTRDAANREIKEAYLTKELSVEVLPALTPKEIEDLRVKQAMAANIG